MRSDNGSDAPDSGGNFKHKKRFGQNFISDVNFLRGLLAAAGIGSGDRVLEIGAGAGTLTRELCAAADEVVSYEIDSDLKPVLEKNLATCRNLRLVFGDALRTADGEISALFGGRGFKLVANLPYYITTPLIFKFLNFADGGGRLTEMAVMVQSEVADRIIAREGTKEYGALSVAVRTRGEPSVLKRVGRGLFYPRPDVDSAFVLIRLENKVSAGRAVLDKLIRAAFAMRRKTLVNNLTAAFPLSRADAEKLLLDNGIPAAARGETLSPETFIKLAASLE